ncbi:MAG: RimK/LysX family protein [Pirellulales bacterium]|nr:RimK/LysX family protein [Pirellulales bacterium]
MFSSAKARHTNRWFGARGGMSLLVLLAWMSYGLLPGPALAAQTEQAAAEDTQESSAETKEEATSDEQTDSKEKPDREGTEEEADDTDQAADAEQPGDKDATVESERPLEEEPPKKETAEKDKEPSQDEKAVPEKKKCIIGATATLMEKKSEIVFRARVDSGAKSCSLHVEQIKIDDESETMADNIGKVIHFEVKNGKGKKHWLKAKIDSYVIIKTSSSRTRRYKVPLTFQWKHMEKKVLVTLNNRGSMEYPLLIGRNFLRGDFLVDVELDSDD